MRPRPVRHRGVSNGRSAGAQSGDLIVLFSDGVTEAMNGAGEELGDARLEACLLAVRALPVGEILGAMEREVLTFCGGAPTLDDVTVMVVRIR